MAWCRLIHEIANVGNVLIGYIDEAAITINEGIVIQSENQ